MGNLNLLCDFIRRKSLVVKYREERKAGGQQPERGQAYLLAAGCQQPERG